MRIIFRSTWLIRNLRFCFYFWWFILYLKSVLVNFNFLSKHKFFDLWLIISILVPDSTLGLPFLFLGNRTCFLEKGVLSIEGIMQLFERFGIQVSVQISHELTEILDLEDISIFLFLLSASSLFPTNSAFSLAWRMRAAFAILYCV